MDQYLAFILQFAGNYNPRYFALCQGQILPISSNTALFSLLGTYYGGNGTSNFGLPDLRGKTAIGQGQGPGLSDYVLGEFTGSESMTLLSSNLPAHTHNVNAVTGAGNKTTPTGFNLAEGPKSGTLPHVIASNFYNTSAPNTLLNPQTVSVNVGSTSAPVALMKPYLAINYIIALQGIFPARN